MRIVIPLIVITWILSLISSLAIVFVVPSLFPVESEQIGAGSITADKIADEAILTVKLADGNVTSAKILDGNITAVDIADGSIVTIKILDDAVTTSKIADGNVATAKIAYNAVTESKIAADAILTVKLKDGSVTSAKILDGTVAAVDLADNSVIAVKIANGAVTTEKIADGAITTSKIADGQIANSKLAHGAIPEAWKEAASDQTMNSSTFIPIPDDSGGEMAVNITVERQSTLVIMFRCSAYVDKPDPTWIGPIFVRAFVDEIESSPGWQIIAEDRAVQTGFAMWRYNTPVEPGTHRVRVEWAMPYATDYTQMLAHISFRSLWVMALP